MSTQNVSYGSLTAGVQPASAHGLRPEELAERLRHNGPNYPPGDYRCFPIGGNMPPRYPSGLYPPMGFPPGNALALKEKNYELLREKDQLKSKLYRHEESTDGLLKGGFFGLTGGGALGALAGIVLPGGPLVWGAVGAAIGGLIGSFSGQKFGEADAVTRDANDDQSRVLNGSPLAESYRPPAYDPAYYRYGGYGGYGGYM